MKKQLAVYLALACGLTWSICLWLYLSGSWLLPQRATIALAACMFCPALAVLAVQLLFKPGWSGLGLKPHFKGHIKYYLLAWWGPILLVALGAALWYALNPEKFSLNALVYGSAPYWLIVVTLTLVPCANLIPAGGEEIGWRGWLLPYLRQSGSLPRAVLLSSLIWGLWHGPMIALGHNYGLGYPGYPWAGIAMFCLICLALGACLSWLRLRTDSFWPAALAHGFFNGCASLSLLFLASGAEYNIFSGPLPMGFVGGAFILLAGGLCFWDLCRRPLPPRSAAADAPRQTPAAPDCPDCPEAAKSPGAFGSEPGRTEKIPAGTCD